MERFVNKIFGNDEIIKRNDHNIQLQDLESSVHSTDSVSSMHDTRKDKSTTQDTLDKKSFNPRKISHQIESYDEVGYHLSQHSYHNANNIQIYSEYQASIVELNDNNKQKSADSIISSSPTSPRSPRGIVLNSSQEDISSLNSSINNSNHKIIKHNQSADCTKKNSIIDFDAIKIVSIKEYFTKVFAPNIECKAAIDHLPSSWAQVFHACSSCIFAFIGISLLGLLDSYYTNTFTIGGVECIILIGAFGASAVLVFDCPESPLAQPRNVIGGFFVASIIGVLISTINTVLWVKAALAVSLSIMTMRLLSVVHPPGGAAALIVATSKLSILRFHYVGLVLGGAIIFVLLGIIFNNLIKNRRYPLSY